jgi:hypothetical protein
MVQTAGRATVPRMPDQSFLRTQFSGLSLCRSVFTALLVLMSLLLMACDRNVEPYQPGEQPSQPDLARIFPGPPGGADADGIAAADSGTPDRSALPPSRSEGSAVANEANAAPIEGRIELAAEMAAPDAAVLFVIARPQGVQGGPPLAVLRIPDPEFPLEFSIGPQNVMIPSMRFEGAISLTARLDSDGNAMTRGSGDISSQVEEHLAPGATGVTLQLSERG